MSAETGGTPEEAQQPRREVDPYALFRATQRWLHLDSNGNYLGPGLSRASKLEGALVTTIVYKRAPDGSIEIEYRPASETDPQSEK